MESSFEDAKIEIIKAQDVENVGNLGKCLDKHIAPGHLYIIEQHPNLMASCLYNIRKTMFVFSSKANGAQLLMEAAENELRANPSKSRKNKPNSLSNDLMVAEKMGIVVIAQQCPTEETQEEGSKDNNSELVFHNKWWDDTPKREQSNSIFDYWEP